MILLGLGILCLLLAVALLINPVRLITQGQSAEGVVSDIVKRSGRGTDNKDRDEYTATIRFKTGDRNMAFHRSWYQDPYSSSVCISGCFSKGEKLKVRYLADNPEIVEVDSFWGLFGRSFILGWVGAVFALVTWFWKRGKAEPSST